MFIKGVQHTQWKCFPDSWRAASSAAAAIILYNKRSLHINTNTYVKDVKVALVSVSMHMRTESHKQHTELRHNAQVVALPASVSYYYGSVQ
jgi:hypothetical protein